MKNKYNPLVKGKIDYARTTTEYFVTKTKNGYRRWSRDYYISEYELHSKLGLRGN